MQIQLVFARQLAQYRKGNAAKDEMAKPMKKQAQPLPGPPQIRRCTFFVSTKTGKDHIFRFFLIAYGTPASSGRHEVAEGVHA